MVGRGRLRGGLVRTHLSGWALRLAGGNLGIMFLPSVRLAVSGAAVLAAVAVLQVLVLGSGAVTLPALSAPAFGSGFGQPRSGDRPVRFEARPVRTLPRPPVLVGGLAAADGWLYESSARYSASDVSRVHPGTGRSAVVYELPVGYAGRGTAVMDGGLLVQLTRAAGIAFVHRRTDLEVMGILRYEGEGLGLCHDGTRFVFSDGSSTLTFRASDDFRVLGSVDVVRSGRLAGSLGELECVRGFVFAHLVPETEILQIDPRSGRVGGIVDLSPVIRPESGTSWGPPSAFAHDPERGTWYVAGLEWPVIVEAVFAPLDVH